MKPAPTSSHPPNVKFTSMPADINQVDRFPPVMIQQAMWLYVSFALSFRDVEDLLAERGIIVFY
jgi:transposase-like protein